MGNIEKVVQIPKLGPPRLERRLQAVAEDVVVTRGPVRCRAQQSPCSPGIKSDTDWRIEPPPLFFKPLGFDLLS